MREIKIRCWDGKEMFFPETENNNDTFYAGFNAGKIEIRDYTTGIEDNLCIPMQYTGLKDKNGKEIYEGDIVRINIPVDENNPLITNGIFQVIFDKGMFCISIPEGNYPLSDYLHQDCEVIGNIYENPELLKQ